MFFLKYECSRGRIVDSGFSQMVVENLLFNAGYCIPYSTMYTIAFTVSCFRARPTMACPMSRRREKKTAVPVHVVQYGFATSSLQRARRHRRQESHHGRQPVMPLHCEENADLPMLLQRNFCLMQLPEFFLSTSFASRRGLERVHKPRDNRRTERIGFKCLLLLRHIETLIRTVH